jgi:hypothetical protein
MSWWDVFYAILVWAFRRVTQATASGRRVEGVVIVEERVEVPGDSKPGLRTYYRKVVIRFEGG